MIIISLCYNIYVELKKYLLLTILIVLFLTILYLNFQLEAYKRRRKFRYRKGNHYRLGKLLTKNEYSFYMTIKDQVSKDLIIHPKVRLEDMLEIIDFNKEKYRGYVKSRHIDFLLCNEYMQIICAIELDDASHNEKYAKEVDKMKDDIFRQINIPLIRCYNNKSSINQAIKKINKIANTN